VYFKREEVASDGAYADIVGESFWCLCLLGGTNARLSRTQFGTIRLKLQLATYNH